VRSKTKFWQMLGRGTRLCPDLFGPGQDKQFFQVFDYCQNLEYFGQDPEATDVPVVASLGKRLFTTRLQLIGALDQRLDVSERGGIKEIALPYAMPANEVELRRDLAELLHRETAAMNLDNFVVRPRRRIVEQYAKAEAWKTLTPEARSQLAAEVAGLPSEMAAEGEEARRFDLLVLRLQLALLRAEPAFQRLREQVMEIAALLEEKAAIPMVREQMVLILALQTDDWWQDVTVAMLEALRRKLRELVRLIEKRQRKQIYTDFDDEMGDESEVALPGFTAGTDYAKFRAKAQAFLRAHQDHVAIHKLRMNRPLTVADLGELERMLAESGVGAVRDIERAASESHGLGLFVRSLLGMDREAAKQALAGFLAGKTLAANQIEFVNLIVNHLTEHGVLDAALLYESPFIDITPRGPEALFSSGEVDDLIAVLAAVRDTAVAA